jgi:hypothetical protein
MGTRQAEHADDEEDFPNKHDVVSSTDGGACLTGHDSGRDSVTGKVKENSCNYRWQAFRRALDADSGRYNWPRYQSLCGNNSFFTRLRFGLRKTKPPDATSQSWNVTEAGMNFRSSCNLPYWHESHHIVPNGELRDSIEAVGTGNLAEKYRICIRKGLLEEKYNLNFMDNMVILPMDRKVAKAIQLPRHRQTPGHRSHKAYSKYVRGKLDSIFSKIRDQEKKHLRKPKYKACKRELLDLSAELRTEIFAAGGLGSLDQAFKKLSKPAPP